MITTRSAIYLASMLCIFTLASPPLAFAQHVGTYNGQQANGQPFSLTVSRYKGQLIVESINVQVLTTCTDGQTLNVDTGYGSVGPIVNGAGQNSFNFGPYYFTETFTFDEATHSVSGFVKAIFAIFKPASAGSTTPTRTTVCSTGNQAYAAVLGQNAEFDKHLKRIFFRRPTQTPATH